MNRHAFAGEVRLAYKLLVNDRTTFAALLASSRSLTANVINTAIARAGYAAQRDATGEVNVLLDEQIRSARVQYKAGIAPYSAVLAFEPQHAADAAAPFASLGGGWWQDDAPAGIAAAKGER